MKKDKKAMSLKSLTKSAVWDVQENDIFRMLQSACKEAEIKDSIPRYLDIIRSAFMLEEVKVDKPEIRKKIEARGFKIQEISIDENNKRIIALKKKAIARVTDLTYENIRHISAAQLLEVIDKNFGGGWDSLSQSIQDIIISGFDISTSTLPKENAHSGMYKKKVADGYEVLEIKKGNWVESIFAKEKPAPEKITLKVEHRDEDAIPEDDYNKPEEDELPENFGDDITEENYSTTFEIEEDPEAEAEEAGYDEE